MLRDRLKNYNIILASGSPRRQQFFKELDLDFTVQIKSVDEIYPTHLKAAEITDYLVKLKANAFEGELNSNDLLFTSDTIVWHQEKALGKPQNEQEAFEMIRMLSGETHQVITSVCVKTTTNVTVFNDITQVTFTELSDEMIHYYIKQYKPVDKAGSYGIQEWIGLIGISKIEGSYANVVGLPTQKVFDYLNTLK